MALEMNVRPEDKPKLIGMVVASVLCVGFAFTRLLHGPPPAQADSGAASPAAGAPAVASPASIAGATSAPPPPRAGDLQTLNLDESVPVPFSADPFRPVPGTMPKPAPSETLFAGAAANRPVKTARRSSQGEFGSGLAILPPMKVNVPAAIAQEPTAEIALKGTIEQEKSMAILKVGDKTFYLTAGESLPGGVIVEKVTGDSVVLRSGRQKTTLTPGQSLKPSAAPVSGNGGIENSL